jgi:hypothetical protein
MCLISGPVPIPDQRPGPAFAQTLKAEQNPSDRKPRTSRGPAYVRLPPWACSFVERVSHSENSRLRARTAGAPVGIGHHRMLSADSAANVWRAIINSSSVGMM